MPQFTIINEVAVIGCTFLMLAISTVWYSHILFGKQWEQIKGTSPVHKSSGSALFTLVATGVCYAVMLSLVAYLLAVAPLLSLSFIEAACGVFIFVAGLHGALCVSEQKPLAYFLIQTGFYAIFILGGAFVMQLWPW